MKFDTHDGVSWNKCVLTDAYLSYDAANWG